MNLVRLRNYDVTRFKQFDEILNGIVKTSGDYIVRHPHAVPGMLIALDQYVSQASERHIALVYDDSVTNVNEVIQDIYKNTGPLDTLVYVNKNDQECMAFLKERLPFLYDCKVMDNKLTIYVCKNFSCQLPTTNPNEVVISHPIHPSVNQ